MTRPRSILLTIPALTCGGAERVLTTLANHWVQSGWKVTLLTHERKDVSSFYPLDSRINLIQIDALSLNPFLLVLDIFKRFFRMRKAFRREHPGCVLSFMDMNNVLTLLAAWGLGIPVYVAERTNPEATPLSFLKKKLRDWAYGKAQKIIVQTERIRWGLSAAIHERTVVIPNPFSVDKIGKIQKEKKIVACGRLGKEKGFDVLIKAFFKMAPKNPEWHLVIWGEGGERVTLEDLITRLGLSKQVSLPGRTHDVFSEMAKASIFVLSSRFEGMPNALGEAMTLGLPVIATDCPTGPGELIEDGDTGLLVPVDDEDALATAMEKLIQDEGMRESMGSAAKKSMAKYDLEAISARWEDVFDGKD